MARSEDKQSQDLNRQAISRPSIAMLAGAAALVTFAFLWPRMQPAAPPSRVQAPLPTVVAPPPPHIFDVLKLETVVQAHRVIEGGLTTGRADEKRMWRLLERAVQASKEGWDMVVFASYLAKHQVAQPQADVQTLDQYARIDAPKGNVPIVIYPAKPPAVEVVESYVKELVASGFLSASVAYQRAGDAGDDFELRSAGPDGVLGTADDVTRETLREWGVARRKMIF